jgi:hypothetical protein
VAYLTIALLAGIIIGHSNTTGLRQLRQSSELSFFQSNRELIAGILNNRSPDSPEAWKRFVDDAEQQPAVVAKSLVVREALLERNLRERIIRSIRPQSSASDGASVVDSSGRDDTDPSFKRVVLAVSATKAFTDLVNGNLILVGNFPLTLVPLLLLFSLLLAVYFAFLIQNVFYTPQLILVYPHPQYPFLLIQLVIVMLAPLVLLTLIEATYWADYNDLVRQTLLKPGLLLDPSWTSQKLRVFDYEPLMRLQTSSLLELVGEWRSLTTDEAGGGTSAATAWHLTAPSVIFPVASLIAAAIWLTRRFGWGVFLSAVLAGGVEFALLSLLIGSGRLSIDHGKISIFDRIVILPTQRGSSPEVEAVFLTALCTFLLVFVLGISARRARIRKYAVSVGYAGALFSCAFLFPAYFGVAQVDEFEASMICVAVSILALALLELALRQLLRGFLYNPQP